MEIKVSNLLTTEAIIVSIGPDSHHSKSINFSNDQFIIKQSQELNNNPELPGSSSFISDNIKSFPVKNEYMSSLQTQQCIRIVPQQTLPILFSENNNNNCISIDIISANSQLLPIAKQIKVDCTDIEVIRNETGNIMIQYKTKIISDTNAYQILLSLNIPHKLCKTMIDNGW
eukprot:171602_1